MRLSTYLCQKNSYERMIEILQSFDHEVMILLNLGKHHTIHSDFFFWTISQNLFIWFPVLALFFYVLAKNKRKEAFAIIGFFILLILLCDQISSSILKPWIARPRPSHDPSIESLLTYVYNYKGGAFGFPSSHAANCFGFAIFSSLLFRYKPYTFISIVWAILCSYSRIYLGVHFPCDILFGIILGSAIAFGCYSLYSKISDKYLRKESSSFKRYDTTPTGYIKRDIRLIILTLTTLLFAVAISSLHVQA